MTIRIICNACDKPIPSETSYREVSWEDKQRHYHDTPEKPCWQAVKQALGAAEDAVRAAGYEHDLDRLLPHGRVGFDT